MSVTNKGGEGFLDDTCDELFESGEFGVVSLDWWGRIVRCIDIAEERAIASGKSRCNITIELTIGNNIRRKNKPLVPIISPINTTNLNGVYELWPNMTWTLLNFPFLSCIPGRLGTKSPSTAGPYVNVPCKAGRMVSLFAF